MTDLNCQYNRAVWFDIPVADLGRAIKFYEAVLNIKIHKGKHDNHCFGIFHHENGNGGALVEKKSEITSTAGILLYLNVSGRIKDAITQVETHAGKIIEPIHPIGPYGFRAIVLDSEGNRIALHSHVDA